jgi:hypothetical protein
MGNLLEHTNGESTLNLKRLQTKNKVKAGIIFNNLLTVATKRKLIIQFEKDRIKKIRVHLKACGKYMWFTPYIYNDKLYLAHDWMVAKGKDIFGANINRV